MFFICLLEELGGFTDLRFAGGYSEGLVWLCGVVFLLLFHSAEMSIAIQG